MYHVPVMLRESVEGLDIKKNGVYVDVTFGGGGHSAEILRQLQDGKLMAFDQDPDAKVNAEQLGDARLQLIEANFRYLASPKTSSTTSLQKLVFMNMTD